MSPKAGPEAAAIALFQAGRFDEAGKAFTAIVERDPRNADALQALGVIAMRAGRFAEAAAWLRRAAESQPGSFAIAYNLGAALRQGGEPAEACAAFERAAALDPKSAEACLGLGNARRDLGDRAGAREAFTRALRANPGLSAAQYNLALVDLEEGRDEAAAAGLARVVDRDPANPEAWNHLGLLAHRGERLDEAIGLYRRALGARPGFAPALGNWGNALKDRGDLDAALARYEEALAANPQEAAVLLNAASIHAERGDLAAARRFNLRALEARPGYPDALYALGLLDLREHAFASGWRGYECRFDTTPPAATVAPPHRPRFMGSDFSGARRLAVRREQGLGDQILFSTLLPELRRRGVAAVVEIDPRLAPAYRRSFPEFEFPAPADLPAALAGCDHEIPLGSLAHLLRNSAASFDAQPQALLQADPGRVREASGALGRARCVAISWRSFQGFGRRHVGERKSIPLECFAALERAGARLVDLQYGDVAEERAAFDERHPGLRISIPGLDTRNDVEGLFAAIEASDRVVTASNVTAHFAGALGKPTWLVYLRANPPFHYWAPRADGRSLWYPSVQIVTDPGWTRWETALAAVAEKLNREGPKK